MDITTSLYSTFSTISQVLAGFIALSSFFITFKIQEFKKIQFLQVQHFYSYLNGVGGLFIGSFHDCPTIAVTLKTLHRSECLGGMKEEMEKILNDENVLKSYELKSLTRMKNVFDCVDRVRVTILNYTKFSIITGLFTILFSIVVLIFVPAINAPTSILLYVIGIIGLLSSMTSMVYVIFVSLKERNYIVLQQPSS